MRTKEKKASGMSGTSKSITALIIISVSVILVLNTFCVLRICCPDLFMKNEQESVAESEITAVEKIESTLLANGLSIIGIAMAVWTGLSIANAISRKEIEKIQEQIDKVKKDIRSFEKTIIPLQNDANGIKSTMKELFLEELLRVPDVDVPTKYFYEEFLHHVVPEEVIAALIKIEQQFYQVYSLHDTSGSDSELLVWNADSGMRVIDETLVRIYQLNLNNEDRKLLLLYLEYRRAEFDFYKGYIEGYQYFERSIPEFIRAVPLFGCEKMPDYNSELKVPLLRDEGEREQKIKIYFANSIGEAYSMIVKDYSNIIEKEPYKKDELDIWAYKAIFFCKCAAEWNTSHFEKPEVYYRNLGCAYERFDRVSEFGKHAGEIIENYKKAFEVMRFDERPSRIRKVYYTLLSYYHVYFVKKYRLFECDECHSRSNEFSEEDICLLKEFYEYSVFGKKQFVKNNIPYVMNGFALSIIILLKLTIAPDPFPDFCQTCCMDEMMSDITTLKLLNVDDDYTKELIMRHEVLTNELRDGKERCEE